MQKRATSWGRRALTTLLRIAMLGAAISPYAEAQTEVEMDPVAYALKGYSGHIGKVFGARNRIQAGAFGLEIPKFYGGNQNFTLRGNGGTLKYDRFLKKGTKGLFAGVDGSFTRTRYTLDATGETTYRNGISIGPRVGYRFELGKHLYLTPWFSCGYVFNPGPAVVVGGKTFDRSSFGFFPTVHIGWKL